MPTSLFDQDVQSVIDKAKQTAGTSQGPFPSPEDWRDTPIYFLMVDRFNSKVAPVHTPVDDPTFADFQGGTFLRIEQKLSYIKALVLLPRNLAQLIAVCDEGACRSSRIRNAKVA